MRSTDCSDDGTIDIVQLRQLGHVVRKNEEINSKRFSCSSAGRNRLTRKVSTSFQGVSGKIVDLTLRLQLVVLCDERKSLSRKFLIFTLFKLDSNLEIRIELIGYLKYRNRNFIPIVLPQNNFFTTKHLNECNICINCGYLAH